MSIRTMARVWQDSQHGGTELLMLLAIADFADDEGNAYPAVGALAKKCRTGSRNAQYVLRNLEDSGELRLFRGKGPRGTNRYRITVYGVQPSAPLQSSAPLQPTASGGCNTVRKGVQSIAPKPSLTINEPKRSLTASSAVNQKALKSLKEFLDECREAEAMAISVEDPIYKFAEHAGISVDMLSLCWSVFKNYYTDGNGSAKRQRDWRAYYRTAVKSNWYKLWFMPEGKDACWTTAGEQQRREMAAVTLGKGGDA